MDRSLPRTTLFMLMSVDGKISTGNSDQRDFDKDLSGITGIKEGLQQYYDLEKHTDINSFNTGRVMAKIGVNNRKDPKTKLPCSFIIVDNKPHLTEHGITYLTKWTKKLFLVTTNKKHPAFKVKGMENLEILYYSKKVDLVGLFKKLKGNFGMNRITIQSGGNMNAELIRQGLVERISVVVAPCIVGGKDTSTLVEGTSLQTIKDLKHVKSLVLQNAKKLKNSYLHLVYKINI